MDASQEASPKRDAPPSSLGGTVGNREEEEVLSSGSAKSEFTTTSSDLRSPPPPGSVLLDSVSLDRGVVATDQSSPLYSTENSPGQSVYDGGEREYLSINIPNVGVSGAGSLTSFTPRTPNSSVNAGVDTLSLNVIENVRGSSSADSLGSETIRTIPPSHNVAAGFDAPVAMAIDLSAAIPSPPGPPPQRFSTQSSAAGKGRPRSSRSCSVSVSFEENCSKEGEYMGMPKVDEDIEVGKKIVRRRKLSTACPPSSNHLDVQAPAMSLVQRALRAHKAAGARPFKRVQGHAAATDFHNENGHMLLSGSEEGQYVGDVLGGLPHGKGQHWVAKRCPPCGGPTGDRHLLYEGDWEYGTKQGFGRMMYTNGQEYRGHFKCGERHGRGAMRYVDGSIFDGEWVKGRKNGLGSCYFSDGGIFKGAFSKDNRDGWGVYFWPNKCRKYEGEWVGDDPVCGNCTNILEEEYEAVIETIPDWCDMKIHLPQALPDEGLELPFQTLRNPELAYYPHACARRQHRIDMKRAALKAVPNPKIVVEHKGSLTPHQMQGLRLAFDKLSPGYYRRTMVNRIQLRRLILLARLDPDSEMGNMLFAKLLEATSQTVGLTYNNFMKTILSFQHPPLF